MAEREIRTISELSRRLEAIGVAISIAQLGRMADGKTESWTLQVLGGLMVVFGCSLEELVRSDGGGPSPR